MNRREILGSLPVAVAAATTIALPVIAGIVTPAEAQGAPGSTWDKVMNDTKVMRVGAALFEPWYFKDESGSTAPGGVQSDGATWRGLCPAVAAEIATALGVKLQFVEITWGNAVAGLQAGQFDTMFALDPTPIRARTIDFSPVPFMWQSTAILAKDSVNIVAWSDLNDPKYRIGVAVGTNQDELITAIAPKAQISRFPNGSEIFAALQANRTDVGIVSSIAADLAKARMGSGKVIVPTPRVTVPGGVAVRKETDSRWKDYLGICAAYLYNTGKTQKLYEEYLSFRNIDPKTAFPVQRELW